MGFPLYVACCFSLDVLKIISLCLVSVSLISMCLDVFLLVFILYETLCFLDLVQYFLSHVGELFDYNLFKKIFSSFLVLFFLWDPYNSYVGSFNIVQELSEASLNYYFFFSCSSAFISTTLSSCSLTHSSVLVIPLLVTSRVFLILAIVLFISVYSLFLLGPC